MCHCGPENDDGFGQHAELFRHTTAVLAYKLIELTVSEVWHQLKITIADTKDRG
jgi:hypothetical protein